MSNKYIKIEIKCLCTKSNRPAAHKARQTSTSSTQNASTSGIYDTKYIRYIHQSRSFVLSSFLTSLEDLGLERNERGRAHVLRATLTGSSVGFSATTRRGPVSDRG